MGAWGWTELQDGVVVSGVVNNAFSYRHGFKPFGEVVVADDTDWNIEIVPDSPNAGTLLTNQLGERNRQDILTCEVQPIQEWANGEYSIGQEAERKHLIPLEGQRVIISGTWSVDRSHFATKDEDISWPWEDGDHGKTEIHPISSLLCRLAPVPNEPFLQFVFYVFSDNAGFSVAGSDSALGWLTAKGGDVPHKAENRAGAFSIALPPGAVVELVEEVAQSRTRELGTNLFDTRQPVAPIMRLAVGTGTIPLECQSLGNNLADLENKWLWLKRNLTTAKNPQSSYDPVTRKVEVEPVDRDEVKRITKELADVEPKVASARAAFDACIAKHPMGVRYEGMATSGLPGEGLGLYYLRFNVYLRPPGATFRTYCAARELDPGMGLRAVMAGASAHRFRDLFGM